MAIGLGLGAALAGGAALSGLIGTGMNHIQRATDRKFNAEQAQIQREWQEQMSNTAYQRAVEDMQNAGINPALAFAGNANPASTPGGSTASVAGSSGNSFSNVLNSTANLVNAFNKDNNNKNNVDLKQTLYM